MLEKLHDGAEPRTGLANEDARSTFRHRQRLTRAWSNREANIDLFVFDRNRAPHGGARLSGWSPDPSLVHGGGGKRGEARVHSRRLVQAHDAERTGSLARWEARRIHDHDRSR